jgi:HAD superfamily hydrolase (TIGR01490 family)
MALALFDLDRTVLSVNSAKLWIRAEVRAGFLSRWQALRAAAWIGSYHAGYTRLESLVEEAIALLAGSSEAELAQRTEAFYAEHILQTARPGALAALARHREAGDVIALLTSSSNYLCAPALRQFDIEHALCNRFEVVEGRFTGKASGAICFGAGKVSHATAFAQAHGADLAEAWFYTDSMSDRPMMEAVGHPVAVNPDPRLRRLAAKRGWRTEDWGEPARPAREARGAVGK